MNHINYRVIYRVILVMVLLLFSSNKHLLGASNWYVDNSLTNSANNGTSWASAWTNFGSVHWQYNYQSEPRVHGGDTLYISGGTSKQVYWDSLYIFGGPDTNTTITVTPGVAAGHNGTVIFDGNGAAQQVTNAGFNGFGVGGNGSFSLDGGSFSNFMFQGFYNTNNRMYAKAIFGSPTHATITRFVVTNCANGIELNPATDVEISYFYMTDLNGDHGMMLTAGSATPGNVRIHHGTIRSDTTLTAGNGPDGIQPDSGTDIHDITFWNDPNGREQLGQHPDAIQSGGNCLRIYNNVFHNWTGAAHSADPPGPTIHDIVYANNLYVYDNTNFIVCTVESSGYAALINSISNIFWLNNTIVDYGANSSAGIGYEWDKLRVSQPTVTNFVFANNLFYRVGNGGVSGSVANFGSYVNTNFNYTSIMLVSNLTYFDGTQGAAGFNTAGTSGKTWTQIPLMTKQPTFVNYVRFSTNSDFHLKTSDTAARGQGTNLTTLFGKLGIPTTDLDGNTLPATGNWTIGAYQSANGNISLSPPLGFHVLQSL
jgi:hypothetical protein